jgi:hypothetical protein
MLVGTPTGLNVLRRNCGYAPPCAQRMGPQPSARSALMLVGTPTGSPNVAEVWGAAAR